MTSETQLAAENAAYQLGWLSYENGDTDICPDADADFANLCGKGDAIIALMKIAYDNGFRAAMECARLCE